MISLSPMSNDETADSDRGVALVTGANKGIGRAIAEQLAGFGFDVWVGARNPQAGEEAARSIGARTRAVQLDVTDSTSIAAAAETIARESQALDVLVNNAGVLLQPDTPPSQMDVAVVRATYEVNVFGVIAVTNAMLPLLRRSRSGRIVNLSTDMASLGHAANRDHPVIGGIPPLLAYNTSKSALNAITLAYANELRDQGILVNSVAPGYVKTDLTRFEGWLSPEEGARMPVRMATLPDGGPTATFAGEDGTANGKIVPW
jgi:NAD(P)-dependent dehydrogenase (short-subunit alcohol dehydrogenase family)